MRQNLRHAEHVTPAFSVRDSHAVLTVGVGLARQIVYVARPSAMPRAGFSFCCHALSVAWRPWPLERVLLLRHGFVGIALLIRRTVGRSGYTCLELSLFHGSVLVELEAVLYSDAGEVCTIIDTSREPLPVCVPSPFFRMQKHDWFFITRPFLRQNPLIDCSRRARSTISCVHDALGQRSRGSAIGTGPSGRALMSSVGRTFFTSADPGSS